MKTYEGKTLDEAINNASLDLKLAKEEFHYIIKNEKKDIEENKPYVIEIYLISDVAAFVTEYLTNTVNSIGIDIEVSTEVNENEGIRVTINSTRNPILIGRGGRTLKALNELVKVAVSNKFKRRYPILLDVGDYKDKKYSQIISIARRVAKEVARQHIDVKLDSMTNDERKIVHEVLSDFHDVKTESIGEGDKRAVVIKYVGNDEHAFQQSEVYYKDIISSGNRFHGHKGGRRHFNKKHQENELNDLLHDSTADFLKEEKSEVKTEEIREENKVNVGDASIDDLPSASITTPIINKDALKDLTDDAFEDDKKEENKQ